MQSWLSRSNDLLIEFDMLYLNNQQLKPPTGYRRYIIFICSRPCCCHHCVFCPLVSGSCCWWLPCCCWHFYYCWCSYTVAGISAVAMPYLLSLAFLLLLVFMLLLASCYSWYPWCCWYSCCCWLPAVAGTIAVAVARLYFCTGTYPSDFFTTSFGLFFLFTNPRLYKYRITHQRVRIYGSA